MAPFVEVMRKADYNKVYDEKLNNRRERRERSARRDDPRQKAKRKLKFFERGMGIDLPFLLLVLVLLIIGMIMMFSASFPEHRLQDRSENG